MARCHHHKFDPITQDEYYGLQAVFAGTDKANREYDPDVAVMRKRNQLRRELSQIDSWIENQSPKLLDVKLQSAVEEWVYDQQLQQAQWSSIEPITLTSDAGASLTRQPDNSIFVAGARPEKDTYTVLARTNLASIRAIRLTVLTDERLPMRGPGRQDNGNFHLNELRVFAVSEQEPNRERRLSVVEAKADFEQAGWGVKNAIDGNPNTAWGIYPEVGKPHYAVFEIQPQEAASGDDFPKTAKETLIRIELDQVHGTGHLIGRFELAVSSAKPNLPKQQVPRDILKILTGSEPRSDAQRRQLAAYVERQRLQREFAALPKPALVYCGTNQFDADGSFRPATVPREVHVLDRGEIGKPLRKARPTALSCIKGLEPDAQQFGNASEAQRRRAWLSGWPVPATVWSGARL